MGQIVKIRKIENLTHDVLRIVLEKPEGIQYEPGQAADVSINKAGWEDQLRAFTFVSLQEDDFIEFNIKIYPERKGVTNELLTLKAGDELIIGDVFGAIQYKGEGVFIAGGAGLTPMLAIFNHLNKTNSLGNNKLIFANKERRDIILEKELGNMLGDNMINVLSNEKVDGYLNGFVTTDIIKDNMKDVNQYFYVCGPDPMTNAMINNLKSIGVHEDHIILEQ